MGKVHVVVGLGFGDEGKGSFVNYLCSKAKNPMVVRFSGGHQVGHTVVINNKRHVFSNFGSGTLLDAPTYWSEYCTLSPTGILKEGNALKEMGIEPKLFINGNAMVTTPFDILQNHRLEEKNNHGSVGVGFGTTIQRNEDHFHLYARDLLYSKIRDEKLRLIINNYYKLNFNPDIENQYAVTKRLYNDFLLACDDLVKRYTIINDFMELLDHELIFEGSQGIMLDTNYGFFPHVTRSNTTSKNAIELIKKYNIPVNDVTTYYITRTYQTRHGNGYMSNEGLDTSYIKENPNETNKMGFQGEFRKSVLDLDLLKYAVNCDMFLNPNNFSKKKMVITCLDQVPDDIPVTINGELQTVKFNIIGKYCGIAYKYPCYSDIGYQFTMDYK
jgi:adenylosuccinate synthase